MANLFIPGEILLPRDTDLSLWSVPACDQYTSEPEFWEAAETRVGAEPSALRMILPEAYLGLRDTEEMTQNALAAMADYKSRGLFRAIEDSYIYIEREQSDGSIRRGVLGLVDLEGYEYVPDAQSPIRATEETVCARLPARARLREQAPIEMPHILMMADDPEDLVLETARQEADAQLYDFPLMGDGGRIRGFQIYGKGAARVKAQIDELGSVESRMKRYGPSEVPPLVLAMGDGNHSLAAAKLYYENLKEEIGTEMARSSKARYALAELVNIRDEALHFYPIHRLICDTDPADFVNLARKFCQEAAKEGGELVPIILVSAHGEQEIMIPGQSLGALVSGCDKLCALQIERFGGSADYIHGDETLRRLAKRENCCGILLPEVDKAAFFRAVASDGPLPKKSFSIGHASDKRYYLECRAIR